MIETRVTDMQVRTLADYYRGTFVKGETYTRSSVAVWNGASWIAVEETGETPGTSPHWKLLAKQGRDGRDAKREPLRP